MSSTEKAVPKPSNVPDEINELAPPTPVDHQNGTSNDQVLTVDWDGPDDPKNPRNWSFRAKWLATALVSAYAFISPVSSSMIAPASGQLATHFDIHSTVILAMITSIFVFGYAFGGLFFGPLSEVYGRSRVLQIANLFYIVWNSACGLATSKNQLIAFRFLAGLGGSAPLVIAGGVIGDLFDVHERGQAIAIYSLAPLLGPCIGPIAGAWIAQKSTWRWVFWSTSIAAGIVQGLGILYLKETYPPVLLQRKAAGIRKTIDEEKATAVKIRISIGTTDRHWKALLNKGLVRPFRLFQYEPIVQLLGLYMAFLYGLIFIYITTIPTIFREVYHNRVGISGLHYIALGVGLTAGSQTNARLMDKVYSFLKSRNGGVGRPEFRLLNIVPGTIILPIGLLLTGWSAQKRVYWLVPDIGMVLVGAGIIASFQSITAYVIDAFTLHAASALAAVSFLRSVAGFGFPLFSPTMYDKLGFGKGDTILAVIAIVIGCPAPWFFWFYGERIRNASRFARKSDQ